MANLMITMFYMKDLDKNINFDTSFYLNWLKKCESCGGRLNNCKWTVIEAVILYAYEGSSICNENNSQVYPKFNIYTLHNYFI